MEDMLVRQIAERLWGADPVVAYAIRDEDLWDIIRLVLEASRALRQNDTTAH